MARRTVLAFGILALSILALASCARPNRVSRGLLRQLARKHEPYVLVFGSLSIPVDSTAHPTIRFVHQLNRAAPEYLLREVAVAGNHRFYAILNKPAALAVLDEFEASVGSANTAWDKITYVRLHPGDGPLAFYIGEIDVTPPPARNVPGQTMTVAIRDDFQNAAQELRRLYPEFAGAIIKAPLLRAPVPVPAPPRLK
jgi:hypothetical protein